MKNLGIAAYKPEKVHEEFFAELIKLGKKYEDKMDVFAIMALMANVMGQLIGMIEDDVAPRDRVLAAVMQNILAGVADSAKHAKGGHA